jgi:5'-nucleotidase
LLNERPKMIISGINSGENLGVDDVLYSGTVAAAMEGRFLGFPAIAVSLAGDHTHYDTAGRVVQVLVQHLMRYPLPNDTVLNVNVPNVPFDEIQGYKVTRLGRRHSSGNMVEARDPLGQIIYWVGPRGALHDAGPETDYHAINNNYVSMTPLETDLTSYKIMDDLEFWSANIEKRSE